MKMPIIPISRFDPVQTNDEEIAAIKEFKSRFRAVKQGLIARVKELNVDEYPSKIRNNSSYAYRLYEGEFNAILDALESDLLGYLVDDQWLYHEFIEPTYKKGILLSQSNMRHQIGAEASFFTPEAALIRRLALTKSRVFEDMKNLASSTKAGLARALSDGIANGRSRADIAREISKRFNIDESRASTIARTEISTAMKRARLDEAEAAQDQFGLSVMMMQASALSPTTRWWHADRHGKLFSIDEVRGWLSESRNSINCKCTFVEVLVGGDGKPIANALSQRIKRMREMSVAATKEIRKGKR